MTPPDPALLRQKLCGYRCMPDPLREQLHQHIGQFLKTVSFETPDRIDLTEEMKTLIAAHASLLLTGGIGEFSNLKTIHVHRREFRRHNQYLTTCHDGPELHLAWDAVEEGMDSATGWNPLLFRLPEALLDSVGWRGHEEAFARYQQCPPRLDRLKHENVVSPDHALQILTQDFFETPDALQSQDPESHRLLSAFYETDPLKWKTVRREAVGNQPLPSTWNDGLGKLRYYNEMPADTHALLHQRMLVLIDEIDFEGDWRLEVTEEMKVTLAAHASLLLLGSNHEALEGLSRITLESGTQRHAYQWQGDHLTFGWEKIQENLADTANAQNGLLLGFFSFLKHPKPSESPALAAAFAAYENRKRSRNLFSWEWDGFKTARDFAADHFVTFFEQPHNVQNDLPELYAAFQEYFALDPLEWDRLAKAKRRVSFDPRWRKLMRDKIGLYKKLPKPEQQKLEQLMPDFLAQVEFIPQGVAKITEEMKVTVTAEACILILNRGMSDYRNLRTVEIWQGNPEGKRDRVGDATRDRVRLNWESTQKSAQTAEDNHNLVLHEFAHVVDNADDGDADSIPLPANATERRQWEDLIRREQAAIRRSRYRDDQHLIDEYGASSKAEFFTCATEAFFEKPVELQRDHTEIYEILKDFYQLDPAAWPGN